MCDDIFEEIDKDREVNEREWQKSVYQINKAGYREGLDKGKEDVLQEGFNKAFSASSQLVYKVAEMRGKIRQVHFGPGQVENHILLAHGQVEKIRISTSLIDYPEFRAKLSYNLMRQGKLTDKQELDLQSLLQDVVLLESELLQYSEIQISDWISDTSKVYSDSGDSDTKSRGPVCDSDQSDKLGTVSVVREPMSRTKADAGGDNSYHDQTKESSDSSVDMNIAEGDKMNPVFVETKLSSWTKNLENILLKHNLH